MKSEWEHIGNISVDAGICWVGDPCYIVGDDASSKFDSWDEFVDAIVGMDINKGHVALPHSSGIEGLGVVCSTGGDGLYPVYIKRRNGSIAELKVVFQ